MSASTATAGSDARATIELDRWARREGEPIELGKALALTDTGELTGYVATWDVDRQNERFEQGAFKRSIMQAVPAGKVMLTIKHLSNGADVSETIGKVLEAREDDRGLWIRASFSASKSGQDARTKVNEGLVQKLSVGFRPIRFSGEIVDGKSRIVYHEAEFVDATLTNRPVNPNAVILSAKSEDGTKTPDAQAAPGNTGQAGKSEPEGTAHAPASTSPAPIAPPVATVVRRDLEQYRRRLKLLIR